MRLSASAFPIGSAFAEGLTKRVIIMELLVKTVCELPNGNILLEKRLYFLTERDIIELRKKTNWIKGAHGYFAGSYPEGGGGSVKKDLTNGANSGIINTESIIAQGRNDNMTAEDDPVSAQSILNKQKIR